MEKGEACGGFWGNCLPKAALRPEVEMAGKPLDVEIFVRQNGELRPYGELTEEEKRTLSESLNKRAIRAAAGLRGYDVEFLDFTQEQKKEKKQG